MFSKMDKDGSASLDAEEFRLAIRKVAHVPHQQMSDEDIAKLFNAIDAGTAPETESSNAANADADDETTTRHKGNGTIELEEFAAFMRQHGLGPLPERPTRAESESGLESDSEKPTTKSKSARSGSGSQSGHTKTTTATNTTNSARGAAQTKTTSKAKQDASTKSAQKRPSNAAGRVRV